MPRIAVIIVNYGTASLAAGAVRSVLAQDVSDAIISVHVVDNAAGGDDAALLRDLHAREAWGAQVTLHLEEVNHGFGRGNNVALEALAASDMPPDYVLLLNPDAALTPDALGHLAAFMAATPTAGCVGARITQPATGPVSAAFRFPTALVEFVSAANIGPLTRAASGRTLWHAPDIPTQPVDWVAGAAVMFRMEALREAGFFDPDFFLYFEETELMWRLSRHGWACWYLAEAEVTHLEGAATQVASGAGQQRRRPSYWYISQRLYYAKTASRPVAIARAASRWSGAVVHASAARMRGRRPDHPARYATDFARLVLLPLLNPVRVPFARE